MPKGIQGTAILYAAAPGQTAEDGPQGGHGVFTGELLKALDRPGLKLEEVFKRTAAAVARRTKGRQAPWFHSSVNNDFYFRPGKGGTNMEAVFWQSIQGSTNPAMFKEYLRQYSRGQFAGLARLKIEELKAPQMASFPPAPTYRINPLDEEMVAAKTANIRAEPNTDSSRIGRLAAGTKVDVTGKTVVSGATWYRVALAGNRTGYVFGTLLKEVAAIVLPPQSPTPTPVQPQTIKTPRLQSVQPVASGQRTGPRPDLSRVSAADRQSIESTCGWRKQMRGPADYYRCVEKMAAELGF